MTNVQWRCSKCGKLILEYEGSIVARQKCERCNFMNDIDTTAVTRLEIKSIMEVEHVAP